MPEFDLKLTCPCGEQTTVRRGMAGTTVVCRCGRRLSVPTLREWGFPEEAATPPSEPASSRKHLVARAALLGSVFAAAVLLAVLVVHRGRVGNARENRQAPRVARRPEPRPLDRPVELPKTQAEESPPDDDDYFAMLERTPFSRNVRELPREIFGGDRAAMVEEPAGTVDDPAAVFGVFCSTCHVLPSPDVEPKRMWPMKIRQMYRYARGPRPQPPERIPPMQAAIEYWTSRAPDYLAMPDEAFRAPASPHPFARRLVSLAPIAAPATVSCVVCAPLRDDGPAQWLLSDAGQGLVVLWTPSDRAQPARVIGRVRCPSNLHVVDLDRDGLRDVLVADLGEFLPVDTDRGSVVWLRNRGNDVFEPVVLIGGLGRVNDVRAADFDGDGDLDLVVGVFGNVTTGMLLYLENCTRDYAHPDFEPIPLDYRTGTSDVPTADLNGDGHLDVLVLQSQEHDHVLAFLNRGWGSFSVETVYKAPHPRWGSTGIRLADLDGDGDLDVVYNHGDAAQFPPFPRPYHGVSWLENRGGFPFVYHRLTHLPGAQTSLVADLDGDGRLDVVSSAFIPGFDLNWPGAETMDSIVWLRQTSPGRFQRYSLETRLTYHPCGAVGDYDGDGDLDIVMGNFYMLPFKNCARDACLTVLENQAATPPSPKGR